MGLICLHAAGDCDIQQTFLSYIVISYYDKKNVFIFSEFDEEEDWPYK